MKPDRLMRTLLIAMWVTAVLSGVLELALESTLPAPLREWVEQSTEADPTPVQWIGLLVGLVALVLAIWGTVRLWQLENSGANQLLVAMILSLFVLPTFGPTVSSSWGPLLDTLSTVLSGVIFGWIYIGQPNLHPTPEEWLGTHREPPPPPRS